MSDFNELSELRFQAFITSEVAKNLGHEAIYALAESVYQEAGEMLLELIKRDK